MSSAETALWARRRGTTRADIHAAIRDRRALVRTSFLRMTLHPIATRDFAAWIAAMRPTALGTLERVFGRLGVKPSQVGAMTDAVMDALAGGPKTHQELMAHARTRAKGPMKVWLQYSWSAVRPAVVEGLIVYGPPRGGDATFVRTDAWLPPQPGVDLGEARARLARRFLGAFGPATPRDFCKWTGMKAGEAKSAFDSLGDDAVQVSVDEAPGWLLRRDLATIGRSVLDERPRLLPAFDSLLLAHATKDHLVEPRHYKRVYRPQGWISPVVLQGGRIIGVWFPRAAGGRAVLEVNLFGRVAPSVRRGIEAEAGALGAFKGERYDVRFIAS